MRICSVIFFALSAFGLSDALAHGSGTVDFADLDDLLRQETELFSRVKADFDIFRVGDAAMITREENLKLNGRRIGPYYFYARPKGSSGAYSYEIQIETQPIFYDKAGRHIALLKAFGVREEFRSISIRPLTSDKCFTPLPDQR